MAEKKTHTLKKLFSDIWRHNEFIFWGCSLGILAFSDPYGHHYTLCLFSMAGIDFCPGCGLGHAISFLFRGMIEASIQAHPLGIPALLFILLRMYRLLPKSIIHLIKTYYYGHVIHEYSER